MKQIKWIIDFYVEGIRSMRLGKKLWLLVFIKLFIIFAIIKILFFPDLLKERFHTDQQRSNYILQELTQSKH